MPESVTPSDPQPVAATPARPGQGLRVLLAGGGTAGHVNPLLATAQALRDPARGGDGAVRLGVLGTREGLEADLVPAAGLSLDVVPKVPFPRRPGVQALRFPASLRQAIAAAGEAMDRLDAQVVVGFGGYVSTPAYLAARRRGLPVVIHEQNARPGLANRLGARWAKAVALTFPSTPLAARHGRTQVTGLPLRGPIAELAAERASREGAERARHRAAQELGLDPGLPTLVVTGGSLGAAHLNEVVSSCLPDLLALVQVLHLTGRGKDAPVRQAARTARQEGRLSAELAGRYHVLDYLPAMELAYACADVVVCRSGAGTVAELSALGLPALYVPLAIGNGEQRLNAADVVAAGGGRLVADADLAAADLLEAARLAGDPQHRLAGSQAAASVGVRDAASRLAGMIRQVAAAGRS